MLEYTIFMGLLGKEILKKLLNGLRRYLQLMVNALQPQIDSWQVCIILEVCLEKSNPMKKAMSII